MAFAMVDGVYGVYLQNKTVSTMIYTEDECVYSKECVDYETIDY